MASEHGPWIDLHAHPGQCFSMDLEDAHPLASVLGGGDPAVGLRAARAAGLTAVSFATVADLAVLGLSPRGGLHAARPFRSGEAHSDHLRQMHSMLRVLAEEGIAVARTAADIDGAHGAGAMVALLTCEGGDFIDGELGRVEEAHGLGMSSLTLVHYRVNELGDIQTEPPVHDGLTELGRDVVRECNRLGILIDCAHASEATTMGVLEASDAPVMISHSHLDHADRPHPRLLSAAHASAIAQAGGLVGVWPSGVTNETFDDFVDEIVRLADLIGVDHVGIGTDLDANYRPVLTEHAQFSSIAENLSARGMAHPEIDRGPGRKRP